LIAAGSGVGWPGCGHLEQRSWRQRVVRAGLVQRGRPPGEIVEQDASGGARRTTSEDEPRVVDVTLRA